EGVVLALLTAEEAGHAAFLAQGAEPVLAARHHLVRVRLVPDVPNNLVLRGVEDIVKGDRELDRSEARAEMAAGLRHGGDKRLADVRGKLDQLLLGELLHVLRGVDPRENLPLGHRVRLRRMWLDLAIAGCHGAFPWCMDPKGSSGHERRAMDDPAGGRWPRCRGRSGGVGVPGANPQVPITSRTLRRGIRVIGNVSAKYTSARPFLAAGERRLGIASGPGAAACVDAVQLIPSVAVQFHRDDIEAAPASPFDGASGFPESDLLVGPLCARVMLEHFQFDLTQ